MTMLSRAPLFAHRRHRRTPTLVLLAAVTVAGCGGSSTTPPGPSDEDVPISIPAKGTASTFDVGTWNVLWFGDVGNGPRDEALQLRRVRDVINGADLDLWGVQEVVEQAHFASLLAQLPGYAGFLANDPSVANGPAHYSDFSNREQKVGLIYRTSVVQVLGAKVVLTEKDHEFAGRPPLEVRVRLTLGGATRDGVVLVLHAKADTAEASWLRRKAGSEALQAYLDAAWPDVPVWVLGDFNDDVDTSISLGRPSPYANLVAQGPRWVFPTAALSAAGISTTTGYSDAIDHILASDEAMAGYAASSAEAYRVDSFIPSYNTTTSDHFPVLARFRLN